MYVGAMTDFLNFHTFRRAPKPNNWLVLPEGFEAVETADAVSPRIGLAPDALFGKLERLVDSRRDWKLAGKDAESRRLRFVSVTRLMRFRDDIDIQVLPAAGAAGDSEVAIYSRSRIGYSDLGTNAKRVKAILAAISAP